jgi:hypothetical protein
MFSIVVDQSHLLSCDSTGLGVFFKDDLKAVCGNPSDPLQRPLYDNGDIREAQLTIQKGRNGLFISGIENRGCCSTQPESIGCQPQTRKTLKVGSLKMEFANLKKV